MSFVYLLVDKNAPRFKIGRSKTPLDRLRRLEQEIDLEASMQIQCAQSHKLEKTMQLWASAYAVEPEQIGHCEGYTEWFSIDGFSEVLDLIQENYERLRCSLPEQLSTVRRVTANPKELQRRPQWDRTDTTRTLIGLRENTNYIRTLIRMSTWCFWHRVEEESISILFGKLPHNPCNSVLATLPSGVRLRHGGFNLIGSNLYREDGLYRATVRLPDQLETFFTENTLAAPDRDFACLLNAFARYNNLFSKAKPPEHSVTSRAELFEAISWICSDVDMSFPHLGTMFFSFFRPTARR